MNLYPAIIEKLARDRGVLDQAMTELAHWEQQGFAPAVRLAEWRRLLENARQSPEGMAELRRVLLDESEEARRLKDFAPFAGVLSREERRKVFLTCAYDH